MPRLKPQEIDRMIAPADAPRPRGRPRKFEPMEAKIGQDQARPITVKGGHPQIDAPAIEVVDRPVDEEKLAMLKFMEDMVTVHIHTTTDPTAAQVIDLYNNGRPCLLRRGETATIKRYYVEQLARAKETSYTQNKVRMADGTEQYVPVSHTALRYPFSVTKDPHPRGEDWLKHVLAEA